MKGIPIKVTPGFFITAGLIGLLNSFSLVGTLIWMGVIFVSVLVHELGHALAAKLFGQQPRIELIAFGGLTIPEGPKLKKWKEFIVVLMGPLFGFSLFVGATLLLLMPFENPQLRSVLLMFRFVNLFWTFVNLLPILPLDGGQLLRIILEAIFGSRGWKGALYVSLFFSTLMSVAFFMVGLFLIGAIFLIFAFQTIETIRRFGSLSEADQTDENRNALKEIERLLKLGQNDEAAEKLEVLIARTKKGLIYTLASEYLARIYSDREDFQGAYDILNQLEKQISREAKVILYHAAFKVGDHQKVVNLSGFCFQEKQTVDVAIQAAASHAALHETSKAISWLKTIQNFKSVELKELVKDPAFDPIRDEESFQDFIEKSA